MKLIVGLGNPGKEYEQTRHNAGFLAIDHYLSDKHAINCTSKFNGHICEIHFAVAKHSGGPIKVLFMKPQTFMNRSGEAVGEVCRFYKLNVETDLLVIHDEMDLKFGVVKPAFDSRAAGHNGVQSIIDSLATQKFARLRIGVEGRESRSEIPTEKYVLERFSKDELGKLTSNILPETSEYLLDYLQN